MRYAAQAPTFEKVGKTSAQSACEHSAKHQRKASANTVFYQINLPAASSQMRMQSGWL